MTITKVLVIHPSAGTDISIVSKSFFANRVTYISILMITGTNDQKLITQIRNLKTIIPKGKIFKKAIKIYQLRKIGKPADINTPCLPK